MRTTYFLLSSVTQIFTLVIPPLNGFKPVGFLKHGRAFAFAIAFGVVLGTYSSVFVAKNIVLFMGVNRDGPKKPNGAGTQYADIDA